VYGEDTDDFRPERFMKGDELNPSIPPPTAAFGYGRRICSGIQMAEASIWLSAVSLLRVFEFQGKEGYTAKSYGPYTGGLIS
jgi:cytochrome P450